MPTDNDDIRRARHYLVSGRVQGVGFRAAACEQARESGLEGWVRNCADGRVELVAAGDPQALAQLTEWLQHGPAMARVDHVATGEADDDGLPQRLEIR